MRKALITQYPILTTEDRVQLYLDDPAWQLSRTYTHGIYFIRKVKIRQSGLICTTGREELAFSSFDELLKYIETNKLELSNIDNVFRYKEFMTNEEYIKLENVYKKLGQL